MDDLHSAVLQQEIQDLQRKTFPLVSWKKMNEKCNDQVCSPLAGGHTTQHAGAQHGVGGPQQVTHGLPEVPMAAPLPVDEVLANGHLLHSQFGRQLCHRVMLRGAKFAHALAKGNMPTKPMITSLSGSIDSKFIQEGVKSYTQSLHTSSSLTFAQQADMPTPEGYELSRPWQWYRPWVKVKVTPAAGPATGDLEDIDPVIRIAGPTLTESKSANQANNKSLLGYHWNLDTDFLSTAKGNALNFHSAKRGLRPSWARITEAQDLLRLHEQRVLRHRHTLL